MKRVSLFLILSLFCTQIFAQSVPDPEFSGNPYIVGKDNSLKSLEKVEAQIDIKVKIIGGNDTYYTINSPKSDVRFPKNILPKLIIKVDANTDPSDIITLSKAETKKGQRRFLQASVKGPYTKAKDVSKTTVKLEFKKIREGVFDIILPNDIKSGEYGFVAKNSGSGNSKIKMICFGID